MKQKTILTRLFTDKIKIAETARKEAEQQKRIRIKKYLGIVEPLQWKIDRWNKDRQVKEILHALFKEQGTYHEGSSLIEIAMGDNKSPTMAVFIAWNIRRAFVALHVYSIRRQGAEYRVSGLFDPGESFSDEESSLLEKYSEVSDEVIFRQIVQRSGLETIPNKPIVSKNPLDMRNSHSHHSGDDHWMSACFELSRSGHHDGSDSIREVLFEAEELLLPDSQVVIVIGTGISDRDNSRGPTRYTKDIKRTLGYIRRFFVQNEGTEFTLEWYAKDSDWRMAMARRGRNIGPVILRSV